jgi:MYXO-CTERM domain-containing protein
MKNLNLVLSVAAVAASAVSAYAQSFSYSNNSGDVILAVRDDSGAKNDVLLDLGSVSQFLSGGTYAGLTSPNEIVNPKGYVAGAQGISIQAALQGVYGSTLPSSLDVNLFATARKQINSGGTGLVTSSTSSAFLIAGRTGSVNGAVGTEDLSNYALMSGNANANLAANINGIGHGGAISPSSRKYGYVSMAPSLNSSYTTTYFQGTPNAFGGTFPANTEVQTVTGNSTVADFFYLPASGGSVTDPQYLGNFTLSSNGRVVYVAVGSAVPEPQSYALVGGLGLVAFAAWRRRSSK